MQTSEYLIYFGNLFEAAQFFTNLNNIPINKYKLIARSSSFCHIKANAQFTIPLVRDLPNTLIKVKEYHKGKVKYSTIKEKLC